MQRGNLPKAEEWYKKAINSIPQDHTLTADDIIPYYFLADLREKMGYEDEALTLYKEAAIKGNDFVEPHINLGIAYQKRNLSEEAIKEFRLAIGLNPYLPTPHYNLAGLLAETGDLLEAENELRTVLRIDPEYENAKRHLYNIKQLIKQ